MCSNFQMHLQQLYVAYHNSTITLHFGSIINILSILWSKNLTDISVNYHHNLKYNNLFNDLDKLHVNLSTRKKVKTMHIKYDAIVT